VHKVHISYDKNRKDESTELLHLLVKNEVDTPSLGISWRGASWHGMDHVWLGSILPVLRLLNFRTAIGYLFQYVLALVYPNFFLKNPGIS